jgi:hypothetical protein
VVTTAVDDGRRLLAGLAERGFDVTAAGWVQSEYDSKPYLYITSPQVDREGIRPGFGQVNAALADTQPSRVHPFAVKLLPTHAPLATAMRWYVEQHADRPTDGVFYVGYLPGAGAQGPVWLYPPVAPAPAPAG